jgi:hypothetical protein
MIGVYKLDPAPKKEEKKQVEKPTQYIEIKPGVFKIKKG